MTDKMFWVDVETTGLDREADELIQVCFAVTDFELNVLDTINIYIWGKEQLWLKNEHEQAGTFIWNMHKDSGVWDKCIIHGISQERAEAELAEWLTDQGVDSKVDPMCGSSVQFDRDFLKSKMPKVHKLFHYRNIDISSFKEACRRWNPELYATQESDLDVLRAHPLHEASNDILNTIDEARWYRDKFLRTVN